MIDEVREYKGELFKMRLQPWCGHWLFLLELKFFHTAHTRSYTFYSLDLANQLFDECIKFDKYESD